jgi:hypothetical protein
MSTLTLDKQLVDQLLHAALAASLTPEIFEGRKDKHGRPTYSRVEEILRDHVQTAAERWMLAQFEANTDFKKQFDSVMADAMTKLFKAERRDQFASDIANAIQKALTKSSY